MAHNPTDEHHFVIKQLAKEFDDQFECLRENRKKYVTFQYQLKNNLIMVKQLHTN